MKNNDDAFENNFEISIKEDEFKKYEENYFDAYIILRATWNIDFLDYSLVRFEKEFYLEVDKEICSNEYNFLLIPETYNKKKIHTHNLNIKINGKQSLPVNSDDKKLKELNNVFKISKALRSVEEIKKVLDYLKNTKINSCGYFIKRKIEKYKCNLKSYIENLQNYFLEYYPNILETKQLKTNREYSQKALNLSEENLYYSLLDLKKKTNKKPNELREIIAIIFENTEGLIESKDEHLIGIDFSEIEPADKVHHNLLIKTEEIYTGCADNKKISYLRSFFFGETVEFIIHIQNYSEESASIYYEITPPENTRITNVKKGFSAKNCNLMMENIYKKKENGKVKFFNNFNEKLILHLPRKAIVGTKNLNSKVDQNNNLTKKKQNNNEKENYDILKDIDLLPRLFIKFKPKKMLQNWVFISLFLGILYNSILTLSILHYHFQLFETIKYLIFLAPLYKSGFYQGFWIYGLIIGNRLWLERPSFLWKKSSITSIIIVIWGFILLFLCNLIL